MMSVSRYSHYSYQYYIVQLKGLICCFFFLFPVAGVQMIWHVSHMGIDRDKCGGRHDPCRNIDYVIKYSKDGDEIRVDGNGYDGTSNRKNFYELCSHESSVLEVEGKALRFTGFNGKPRIGCEPEAVNTSIFNFLCQPRNDGSAHVMLHNMAVDHGSIIFTNSCKVEIINTTFTNASLVTSNCETMDIYITESTWYGKARCNRNADCIDTKMNHIDCRDVDVHITRSRFYQTSFLVHTARISKVEILGVTFSAIFAEEDAQYMGGLHLTFSAYWADILIKNSTFKNQLHPNRIKSVTNLFDASIWLKSVALSKNNPSSNVTAVIENVLFSDNERGITLIGPYKYLKIERSVFQNNIAMHAGSAVLVLIDLQSTLFINNCTFTNNQAGKYRENYLVKEPAGAFEIIGSEVSINSACCKGIIMLVGKGGAIRVQRGKVMMNNTNFYNNTARLLGGSIFVDIDGNLEMFNSYVENTLIHDHALQGDMIYSDGSVIMNNVMMIVQTARNSLSMLRHSGNHWTMNITNVWIECPVGYNLRITNSSAYGVLPQGLRRSYLLDQLSYFCESCPRNKYSLDHGYLNYTLKFNNFAYFTLLINGSEPKEQYSGSYIHHEIECMDCPYGGHCVQGITAIANFWGYKAGAVAKFQHCPKGYCCSTPRCSSMNACAPRRQGRLCGRCEAGYAEALFSPDCVSNETCGPFWLLPFAISVGLLYTLFLLFQVDLKQFLFSEPIYCGGISQKIRKTYKNTYIKSTIHLNVPLQEAADTKFIDSSGKEADENEQNKSTPTHARNSCNGIGTSARKSKTSTEEHIDDRQDRTNTGSGFLIILFYYFQDALLLQVSTVYVRAESKSQKLLKNILSGLFKFQLDVFELIEEVCAMPDMTAAPKMMTKALIVPYVIFLFVAMYIVYRWLKLLRGKTIPCPETAQMLHSRAGRKSFSTRLSSGFILALLFTFQKMGTTTFVLLNCVPVEGESVLFIDGSVTCYQYWQYGVLAYAITCVTPFFLILTFGPGLLEQGYISLGEFFVGCICPLPALFVWLIKRLWRRHLAETSAIRRKRSDDVTAVLNILQGPFKDYRWGVCWSGVLIGRRLVLILLYTFVNDTLIRSLCMLLTCFFILLHHVHVQPYKNIQGNIAGTTSAAVLVTLGSINLVRAGFEAAEYTPTGPNASLMKIFDEIENTMMLWFPTGVMSFIVLLLLFRLFMLGTKTICNKNMTVVAADPDENSQL